MELSEFMNGLSEFMGREISVEKLNDDLSTVINDSEFMKFAVNYIEKTLHIEMDINKLSVVDTLNDLFVLINHTINLTNIDIEVSQESEKDSGLVVDDDSDSVMKYDEKSNELVAQKIEKEEVIEDE